MSTFAITNFPWPTGLLLRARFTDSGGATITDLPLAESPSGFYSGTITATDGVEPDTVEIRQVTAQTSGGFDAGTNAFGPDDYLPDGSSPPAPATSLRFEYVPVLNSGGGAKLRIVSLDNVSTKHGDVWTDRGCLYARIIGPLPTMTLEVYADVALQTMVASGSAAVGAMITLAQSSGSGITGRAIVESYMADEPMLMLAVSFAVDQDVILDETQCSNLPGYDDTYGLSYLQAEAMRRILASELPAAVPYLYGTTGLASFVPRVGGGDLPDLTKLASADQLREAAADMVKWLSAKQAENVKEFADLAKVAQANFRETMDRIKEANREEPIAEAQEHADDLTVSFGSWRRR